MSQDVMAGLRTQRDIVRDMNQTSAGGGLGWSHPGFTDPTTREPLTLGEVFDRYATCLAVLEELEAKFGEGA